MKQNRLSSFFRHAAITTALSLTACGPQAFVPNTASSSDKAGQMNLPPKVDIVLGMSSNGTMRNIYPGIQTEIPNFLKNLQNSGWDYRFISIPLSAYHDVTSDSAYPIENQVSVSQYDANTPISSWLVPYPGALHSTAPAIITSLLASAFQVYQPSSSDPVDAHESGFANQINFLNRSDVRNNLLRPDAMLAVITISNGEDRSDWSWGAPGTTDLGQPTVDMNTYANNFRNVKNGSSAAIKYFSVVAHLTTSCRGYGDWSGQRYEQMASMLNGASVDICTSSVANSLSTISNNLTQYSLNFRKKYLVVGTEPNPGTITVTRYTAGNAGQSSTIPQDPNNGWTYDGLVPAGGVYTIDSPVPMDMVTTGYLIELHGSAELTGGDTATVNYQNAGTVTSH